MKTTFTPTHTLYTVTTTKTTVYANNIPSRRLIDKYVPIDEFDKQFELKFETIATTEKSNEFLGPVDAEVVFDNDGAYDIYCQNSKGELLHGRVITNYIYDGGIYDMNFVDNEGRETGSKCRITVVPLDYLERPKNITINF